LTRLHGSQTVRRDALVGRFHILRALHKSQLTVLFDELIIVKFCAVLHFSPRTITFFKYNRAYNR